MLKVKKIFSALLGVAMAANVFMTMPFSAFADEESSRTYTYDGYEVSYDVTNSWGNTEMVSVTLSNTGDSAIENWMMYFDPNGQVHDTVNVQKMQTSDGTTYFKNSGYNATVNPDSSVSFSYMVDDCESIPDAFTLCQTRAEKESGYQVSLKVNQTWGDSFNGEIVIQNNTDKPIEAWELTVDTNFTITEITNSWAATVTELEPYSYMLKGTYTGTVYANSSVSLGFNGVKSGDPVITDYSLTEVVVDEGLFESAELTNAMADGSSVNDKVYAEALYDSENQNIDISWSATAASGISFEVYISDNNKDYELYETVDGNTFNSSYHITDEFLIKYIKIKQTLDNENIIYSNICYTVYAPVGVEWTEYQRKWDIPNSDDLLSEINTESNPYDLSLEFDAAGVPGIHLNVSESSYTNAIDKDYILGTAPEISYKGDLAISDITVKFQISDNYLENELGTLEGNSEFENIKRFNIFKYFEDINMLLPIETKFDLSNNTIYTDVEELGTYCIVDMEKWLNSLDIDTEKINNMSTFSSTRYSLFSALSDNSENVTTNSFISDEHINKGISNGAMIVSPEKNITNDIQTFSNYNTFSSGTIEISDAPIDIVFILQSAGERPKNYEKQKQMILDTSELIFEGYTNARIYVIGYNYDGAYFLTNNSIKYFTSRDDMDCLYDFEYEEVETPENPDDYVNRSYAFDYLMNNVVFRNNSNNFVFTLHNGSSSIDESKELPDQIDICNNLNINYSEVLIDVYYNSTAYAVNVLDSVISSKGICIIYDENSSKVIYEHIFDNMQLEVPDEHEDKVYMGMDWNELTLSSPLQINGSTDSDNDGLTDWEEVNSDFLEKNGIILNDNEYITEEQLPSVWYMLKSKYNCVPFRYVNSNNFEIFNILNEIKVLPVNSNPLRTSSADDGINDFDKLKPECIFDKYKSDYYDKNGKYYNYYDDSDYYYEHLEERYKDKKAFKAYTVESLFTELKDKTLNNESNSTYLKVNGNEINIHVNLMFWDSSVISGKEIEFDEYNYNQPASNHLDGINDTRTVKQVLIEGLKHYWEKSFTGTLFDFYPGMEINTQLVIHDDTGKFDYSENDHNGELYVVIYSEPGRSYMNVNSINIYAKRSVDDFKRSASHEFGHILGLFDYYSDAGHEVPVINDCQMTPEILEHGLMNSAYPEYLKSTSNDVEMALYGAIDNTFSCSQRYIPERKKQGTSNGEEKISVALREKIAYASYTKIRYEWAEEKYFIPVNSEIKTNEFFKYAKGDECAVIIDVAEGFENVETLEIPSTIDGVSVVKISNYAFENQSSLKSIVLPNGIIDIGYSAFENCHNLAEVNLPEQLQYIRQNAFKSCALKEIMIFSDVEKIFDSTFEDCNSLESITVDKKNKFYYSEDGVLLSYDVIYHTPFTTLVKYPAANDRKEYTIPNNVKKIENNAFGKCPHLTSLTISKNVKEMNASSFKNCTSLEFIEVDNDNSLYSSVDGVLFNKEKTKLIKYPVGNTRTEYKIPNSTTEINEYAFYNCKLSNITIPENVTSIETYSFGHCHFTKLVIPGSVEKIGFAAFYDCNKLENLMLNNGLKEISDYAFGYNKLEKLEIPHSVIFIGNNAFMGSNKLLSVSFRNNNPNGYATNMLSNCNSINTIFVPVSSKNIYNEWLKKTGLNNVTIKEEQ